MLLDILKYGTHSLQGAAPAGQLSNGYTLASVLAAACWTGK